MVKKKTAALFILLANIILQAHTVVPHYHLAHDTVVIINSACHENNTDHHHPLDYPFYNHDHSSNNENKNDHCSLKQDIGIPTNILRQVSSNNMQTNSQTAFVESHAIPVNFQFYCIAPVITVDLQWPSLTFSYANCTSGILGLRAPPAI